MTEMGGLEALYDLRSNMYDLRLVRPQFNEIIGLPKLRSNMYDLFVRPPGREISQLNQLDRPLRRSNNRDPHTTYGGPGRRPGPLPIRSRCHASSGFSFELISNPNGGGPYRQAHRRHRPSTISSHSKGATNG